MLYEVNMNNCKNKSRLVGLTSILLVMLVIFSLVLAGQSNISASAGKVTPTETTSVILIDELLVGTRADTAVTVGDKTIFDYEKLTALFNALTGKTSDATLDDVRAEMGKAEYNNTKAGDRTYIPNTSTNDYSNAYVGSIHYGMNSEDIRKVTKGNNIEVIFGGHTLGK